MDLDNLKYNELQKLAKKCGIKANMKVEKLLNALKDHYSKQEQDDSKKAKEETDLQPDAAKEDPGAGNGAEDEPAAKKAPARGRKKGQKRGPKGKAKKTLSSDETQDDDDDVVTLKKVSPQQKASLSSADDNKRQRSASAGRKTSAASKATPKMTKTPTIIKPVSSKSLGNRTPGAQNAVGQAKTPTNKDQKTKVMAGPGTPGLLSPRGPRPASRPGGAVSVSRMTPKTTSDSGKKPASSSAFKESKKSPASGGKKRSSPRNNKQQQDEAKNKAVPGKTAYKRKRQDTFELEEPSLTSTQTPEAERTTKRARLSSGAGKGDKPATPMGDKPATPKGSGVKGEEKPATPGSPSVQDMLDSMSGNMSSAERRTRLMDALNKKVESKVKSSPHAGPVTQIPRFAAFLAKKREEQKKPITPGNKDWAKVHKKEFSKFDSIDVYLEKKRKRAEEMTASVKKARTVLQEVQQAVTKLKSKRTPSLGRKKSGDNTASQPFKPTVMSTKDMNLNFGASSSSSSRAPAHSKSSSAASQTSKPFKPTVTSTKDMKLNFSALKTPVNQKASDKGNTTTTTPTPSAARSAARKSAGLLSARKSLGASARKSLSNTPFHFTGNLNMSDASKSTSKPVFDLKASLARPITWKPHTGKLKPLAEYSTGKAKGMDKSAHKPDAPCRMDVFKSAVNRTQKTYSRHDRRVAAAVKRADQKHDLQMKRRGIVVSP